MDRIEGYRPVDQSRNGKVSAVVDQPYAYQRVELMEPDWRRIPGWSGVTTAEWESAQWQRAHCVKNLRQLREVLGGGLDEAFLADADRDQRERATMSMLVPPQMLNTMAASTAPDRPGFTEAFYADPVRRYMIPVFSDRRTDWPSHPYASRDSLHEAAILMSDGMNPLRSFSPCTIGGIRTMAVRTPWDASFRIVSSVAPRAAPAEEGSYD